MEDRGIVGFGMFAQHGSHLLDIVLNQGGIGSVDISEFVKVLLNVSLTTKDGKDLGTALMSSSHQGRGRWGVFVRCESVHGAKEDQSREEGVGDDNAGILCKLSGDGMDIVSFEVFGDKEQEHGLQDRDELQRRVALLI